MKNFLQSAQLYWQISPVSTSFSRPLRDKSVIEFFKVRSNRQMLSSGKYCTYSLLENLHSNITHREEA